MKYLGGENKESPYTNKQKKDITELHPYFDELVKLVEKWIFKAPWAVGALFVLDLIQSVAVAPSEEQGIPLEMFELMVPWPPPLPPLKIEVSAWTFFEHSRDEIVSEIADRLFDYEQTLREMGIKEFPSDLIRHAKWWFDYYVNNKSLGKISGEGFETIKKDSNLDPKNIRKAIKEFSKLVEINIK